MVRGEIYIYNIENEGQIIFTFIRAQTVCVKYEEAQVAEVYRNRGVYLFVCMVITSSRVCINRVRLPILLVVSRTGDMNISLSALAPKNLVSRDGFGHPVPRQPAHSPHSG